MYLIIDTTTERGIIVFSNETEVLLVTHLPVGFQSSEFLFPKIEEGFKKLGITARHLQGVAACIGPGLFNGMRVGVAAAKGIAYARTLPLVGIPSLLAFVSPYNGRFHSVIDGRSRGVYSLAQERTGDVIKEIGEIELLPHEQLTQRELVSVGPCFKRIKCPSYLEMYPDPQRLAFLATQKLQAVDTRVAHELELMYH